MSHEDAIQQEIARNRATDATVSPHWDRFKALVVEQLAVDPDRVTPTAYLLAEPVVAPDRENLGADSLDVVELIMAVENEFDIHIADDEAEKAETVAETVFLIDAKRAAKK